MMRIAVAAFFATLALAGPASADFCLQMSGGLSGDLGFFRFKGSLPKGANQITTLKGRGAKLPYPVWR